MDEKLHNEKKLSRRDFLKVAGAAGLATAGLAAWRPARTASAAPPPRTPTCPRAG